MKKSIFLYITAAALLAANCAKVETQGPNDANSRFVEAWMHIYNKNNNTDIKPSGLGIYVLDEIPGKGEKTVTDNGYAIVDYTITDLDGNISTYTSAETAKKLGTYNETAYYGPRTWLTMDATISRWLSSSVPISVSRPFASA